MNPGGRIQPLDYSIIKNAIDRSTKLTDKFYGKAPSVNVFFANKLRFVRGSASSVVLSTTFPRTCIT